MQTFDKRLRYFDAFHVLVYLHRGQYTRHQNITPCTEGGTGQTHVTIVDISLVEKEALRVHI